MSKDMPEGLAFKEELNLYRYCNGNLNFSTVSHDDEDYGYQKKKIMRDPMSHRIIEKRRRDRMNNCLADLSRLIPPDYLKKGRGRIEKTEIIEMAIKHMRHLQNIIASSRANEGQCEIAVSSSPDGSSSREFGIPGTTTHSHQPIIVEHYRLGYLECLSEAMHFLVEVQGYFAGDSLCVQMINHLHKHCDKILKSDSLNHPIKHNGETSSNSSVSPTNANYSNNSPPLGLSVSNGSNSDDNQPSHPYESGGTFEPIDDPLRNVGFRSPRRYSDLSSRDSKKACESYNPRYSEPESERISENPSDSDVEQGFAAGGRNKDARGYLNGYDDAPRCNGVDCLPMNCSSSSGIGSTPGYTPPYDEYPVKEENGPSQLRDMLTSPKITHGMHPGKMSEVKRSVSPVAQHFGTETSPVHQNSSRQGTNGTEERQMDIANFKAQDLTVETENSAMQELHQETSENNISDTHGNMYKFKNNIKQRFSKERKNNEDDEDVSGKRIKLSEVALCENDSMGRKYDPLMKERLNLLNKGDMDWNNRKRNQYPSESEMFIQSEIESVSNRLSFGHKASNRSKKWEESVKYSRPKLSLPYVTPEIPMECRVGDNGRKPIGLLAITESLSTEQSPLQKYRTTDGDGCIGIPIFALHSKGSFYVPLTLDQGLLAPFLPLLGLTKTEDIEEKPVLHPVTISVNFLTSHLAKNFKLGAVQ